MIRYMPPYQGVPGYIPLYASLPGCTRVYTTLYVSPVHPWYTTLYASPVHPGYTMPATPLSYTRAHCTAVCTGV